MVIKGDGKVGIGTAAPSEVLEVKGNMTLRGATNLRYKIANDSNNNWSEIGNDGATGENTLEFFTGSSSVPSMSITNSKLVGIGTATPVYTLQGNGLNGGIIGVTRTSGTTTGTLGHVRFGNTDIDSDLANIKGVQDGATDSARLEFETQATGGSATARLTIKSDGSVGIGTNNPLYTVHVKAVEGVVRTDSTTGTNRSGFQMANTGGTGFIMATSSAGNGVLSTGGLAYALQINKSGGSTDAWNAVQIGTKDIARMTIDESGSVGIGTNNPDSLLMVYKSGADSIIHVRGIASGADARVRINGYESSELYIDRNNVGRFAFRRTTGTDDLSLLKLNDDYSDNSTIMFWDYSSGDVGIGQATASYKLDVNGTGRFNDYVWFKGGIRDDSGSAGSNGQVLTTNGSNAVTWATVSGGVSGSGTDHYIPRWNGTTALPDSSMIALDSCFVGIGTATPSTKFQVHSGDILITSGKQLISTNSYTQAPPGMLTIQGPTTGGTTINSDHWGLVIGPQHTRSSTANTYYPGIAFNHLLNHGGTTTYNNSPQAWIGTRLHDTSGSERDFLVFALKSSTVTDSQPVERMCIDPAAGHVGIGTTNPQVLLDVYTTDNDTARFESTSTSRSTVSIRSGSTGDAQVRFQNGASSKWSIGNDGGDSDKFKIAVGSGAFSTSEAVAISTSGCVGIGTNSPLEPLHVYDGGDWQIRMSSGGARAGLVIDKPGTTTTMGSALVVAADETYRLGTASYYHVVMQQGGTVSLQYQGSTRLNTTSGGVTVTGTLTETSSITLKENVETYTPSLDIINKIRPVKYNRKTNKDKKEIGLIAEELAELFPELVEKDEKGNPSSVNYSRAVTVLLGGFKELYKEIEELKKRI